MSRKSRLTFLASQPSIPLKYLIALSAFGLSADQNLMSPSLSAIAREFGMSDAERDRKLGGEIAFAFFLLGAPASVLIGLAADRVKLRRDLLAFTTLFGSLATLGSSLATDFATLFWTRAMAGIAVGGLMPLAFSLLGDIFPPSKRAWVAGALGMAMGCGVGTGQNLAGLVGPVCGWRVPFIIAAVPAILVSFATFFFAEEPIRGAMDQLRIEEGDENSNGDSGRATHLYAELGIVDGGDIVTGRQAEAVEAARKEVCKDGNGDDGFRDGHDSDSSTDSGGSGSGKDEDELLSHTVQQPNDCRAFQGDVGVLLRTPSVLLAFAQGIPGCVPWGVINTFLNDYLAIDRELGTPVATLVQTAMGIGGLAGTAVGAWAGQRFFNASKPLLPVFAGGAAILGTFPFLLLLNLPTPARTSSHARNGTDAAYDRPAAASFRQGAPSLPLTTTYFAVALVSGFFITLTGNNVRAMLQNTTRPRGRGTGFAIFALSDDVGKGLGPLAVAGLIAANGGNRRYAFSIAALGWLLCGALNVAAAFTIEKDCDAVVAHAAGAAKMRRIDHSELESSSSFSVPSLPASSSSTVTYPPTRNPMMNIHSGWENSRSTIHGTRGVGKRLVGRQ